MLTDIVSLVRYTVGQDEELVPFHDKVDQRFESWVAGQRQKGVTFTDEQLRWLTWMKDSIASDLAVDPETFDYTPFAEHGGIGKAVEVFGDTLPRLMQELSEVLAA